MCTIRKGLTFLLFFSPLFFLVSPVAALTISPLRYQVSSSPGTTQTVTVTIQNDQATTAKYKVFVVGVKQDAAGHPIFGSRFDSAEQWVQPETKFIELPSRGKKSVGFLITIPAGTPPGTHLVALTVEPTPTQANEPRLAARAATLLSVVVAGTVYEALSIERWASYSVVLSGKQWPAIISLKNNGTIPTAVQGIVLIRSWWGQEVARQTIPLGNAILTQSFRKLSPLLVVPSVRWPGPYQAQLIVTYGQSHTTASALATIWYIPLWSYPAIIILVVLIMGKKMWPKK